ncbi:MAG: hypothetical protein GVY36_03370 [Verrucomicrobia bacterium]|jgi:hypothetical protein|nr:hypothetical protein [Verrucomicrobiota bacterium]
MFFKSESINKASVDALGGSREIWVDAFDSINFLKWTQKGGFSALISQLSIYVFRHIFNRSARFGAWTFRLGVGLSIFARDGRNESGIRGKRRI